jgi:hypothetical protein
LIIGD